MLIICLAVHACGLLPLHSQTSLPYVVACEGFVLRIHELPIFDKLLIYNKDYSKSGRTNHLETHFVLEIDFDF